MTLSAEQATAGGAGGTGHPIYRAVYEAPIGGMLLVADASGLRGVHLPGSFTARDTTSGPTSACEPLARAVAELQAYFAVI